MLTRSAPDCWCHAASARVPNRGPETTATVALSGRLIPSCAPASVAERPKLTGGREIPDLIEQGQGTGNERVGFPRNLVVVDLRRRGSARWRHKSGRVVRA